MERFYSAGENFSRNTIGLWAEKPKAFLQPKENPAKKAPAARSCARPGLYGLLYCNSIWRV